MADAVEEAVVPAEDVTETIVNAEETAPAETPKVGEEADPQATPEQGETEEQKPKKLGGWQRKQLKAEAERDFWRDEALRARTEREAEKPEKPATEASDTEPDLDTFKGTLSEFMKAQRDWITRNVARDLEAKQAAKEQASSQKTQEQKWNESHATFAEAHDDYEDVSDAAVEAISSHTHQPGFEAVRVATMDPEIGPALLYELGKNPDDIERLVAMQPARALMEIGKIEGRLAPTKSGAEQKGDKPARAISKAPAPPEPVRRASPAADDELRDDLSPAEWRRRYEKKMEKDKQR